MPGLLAANDIYRVRWSGKSIIKRALRLIGVIGTGEELEAAQQSEGLEGLNSLIDEFNAHKLLIHQLTRQSAALTVSTNPHTIGPAGNLNLIRPNKIEHGEAFLTGGSLGTNEIQLAVCSSQGEVAAAYANSGSGQPVALFYEPVASLGNVWLYPVPDAAYTLVLYTWKLLEVISNVDTEFSLPPAYYKALCYNLAIELAPEYGRSVSAEVAAGALESKAAVKRLNSKPIYLAIDPALSSIGGSGWLDENAILSGGL